MRLRLYVAGMSPNAIAARASLKEILAMHDGVHVEIVDVIDNAELAVEDNVLVTPMLLRLTPAPKIKIIGNLKDTASVKRMLGLDKASNDAE